jgi:hypothetical protein
MFDVQSSDLVSERLIELIVERAIRERNVELIGSSSKMSPAVSLMLKFFVRVAMSVFRSSDVCRAPKRFRTFAMISATDIC